MTEVATTRPTLVTVVAVLTVIAGILSLLAGFVWLFLPPDASANGATWRLVGIAYIVLGIVEVAVARGLLRGNPRARAIFAFAVGFNLILTITGAVVSETARGLSLVNILLAVAAVAILYTPKANAFFGRRQVTSTI